VRVLRAAVHVPVFLAPKVYGAGGTYCIKEMAQWQLLGNVVTGRGSPNCNCASACTLIWIAGTRRSGDVVGLHRPSYDAEDFAKLSVDDAERRYERTEVLVKDYLREMGMEERLIQIMFATTSRSMRFLTKKELEPYDENATVMDEMTIARCGAGFRSSDAQVKTQFYYCMTNVRDEFQKTGLKKWMEAYGLEPKADDK
jgi:hypothetical protein